MITVNDFVRPHDGEEVFGLGKINYVVPISGEHMHCLNLTSAHLKLNHFVCSDFRLLDKTATDYHDERLPLGAMLVLFFCDARFRDVNGEPAMIHCFQ